MHEEQTTSHPNSTIVVLGSINLTAARGNDTNGNSILVTATPSSTSSSSCATATSSSVANNELHQSASRPSVDPTQYFFSTSTAITTNTFRDNTPILIDGSHCGGRSVIMNINDDDLYVNCTPVTQTTASDVCILPVPTATTTILVQTSNGLIATTTTQSNNNNNSQITNNNNNNNNGSVEAATIHLINNNNNNNSTNNNNNNTSAADQSYASTTDSIELSLKEATFTIDDDEIIDDDEDDENASQGEFPCHLFFPGKTIISQNDARASVVTKYKIDSKQRDPKRTHTRAAAIIRLHLCQHMCAQNLSFSLYFTYYTFYIHKKEKKKIDFLRKKKNKTGINLRLLLLMLLLLVFFDAVDETDDDHCYFMCDYIVGAQRHIKVK